MNQVNLIGNLGKDPDVRYTAQGKAVTKFSLATSKTWKGKDGNQNEHTEWHNIVAWGPLAEICGKFLTKGSKVYICGEISSRSYDDRDGNKRYITEIVASTMQMLDSKGEKPQQSGGEPFNPDDDIPF